MIRMDASHPPRFAVPRLPRPESPHFGQVIVSLVLHNVGLFCKRPLISIFWTIGFFYVERDTLKNITTYVFWSGFKMIPLLVGRMVDFLVKKLQLLDIKNKMATLDRWCFI